MLAQWCDGVRLTTPSVFRFVPFKPEAILSPLGISEEPDGWRSICQAGSQEPSLCFHISSTDETNEHVHLLSRVSGSCWSEENRNKFFQSFFGSAVPTTVCRFNYSKSYFSFSTYNPEFMSSWCLKIPMMHLGTRGMVRFSCCYYYILEHWVQTLDSSLGFRTGFVPAASGSYFHISVGQRDADGVKLLERSSSRNAAAAEARLRLLLSAWKTTTCLWKHLYMTQSAVSCSARGYSNYSCSKGGSQAKKYNKSESFQLFKYQHEHLSLKSESLSVSRSKKDALAVWKHHFKDSELCSTVSTPHLRVCLPPLTPISPCSINCSCVMGHVGRSARRGGHPAAPKHIISGVHGSVFPGRGNVSAVCSGARARLDSRLCNERVNPDKVQLGSSLISSSLQSTWKLILFLRFCFWWQNLKKRISSVLFCGFEATRSSHTLTYCWASLHSSYFHMISFFIPASKQPKPGASRPKSKITTEPSQLIQSAAPHPSSASLKSPASFPLSPSADRLWLLGSNSAADVRGC